MLDVCNPESGRIQLVAGAQSAENGNPQAVRVFNETQFAGDQINGVDDIVISRVQKLGLVRFVVLLGDGADLTAGVDIQDPLRHDLGLKLPQGGVEGAKLPV